MAQGDSQILGELFLGLPRLGQVVGQVLAEDDSLGPYVHVPKIAYMLIL